MRRLDRAHAAIRNGGAEGWRYFLRVAREEPKLTLGRYVFTPEEVAAEVRRRLIISRGVRPSRQPDLGGAGAIPGYESAVVDLLCAGRDIYWVSDRCGSELNALAEFPLTTAVVVVKPPGSDHEIEVKRAGVRGPRLLDVITERNGRKAPVSHQLFGGSLGWLAEREARAASAFAVIYRVVHGCGYPSSRTVQASSVVTAPAPEGDMHILDYLAQGGDSMQAAMQSCVESFPYDTGVEPASYSGEGALVLRFVGQALPEQAVIFGSTSYRLDRLQLYLSDDGPRHYFTEGLGRSYDALDARWLADTAVEEVLGRLASPLPPFESYPQYVRDLFVVNRAGADDQYLSVTRQFGEYWGTLLAVRGFTDGESFVQRNVGLKSVRQDGEWRTRIIFMDHDDLTVAGSRYRYLWPSRELAGQYNDMVHILGGQFGEEVVPGSLAALGVIYQVSPELAEVGRKTLQETVRSAYRKTKAEIDRNPGFQALFYPDFVTFHRDFDHLYAGYLQIGTDEAEDWATRTGEYLTSRGWGSELIVETIAALRKHRTLLERMRFLYI